MFLFDLLYGLFQGFVTLIIVILVVPIFVQLMLNMFIGMVNNFTRMNIRPMLNIVFFPGAMLRITFLYFVLRMRDWSPNIVYGSAVSTRSPTSTAGHFQGFAVSMRPSREVSMMDVLMVSFAGYFIWVIVLIWILNYSSIMLFFSYLVGYKSAGTWYWLLVLSMVIGGMPIPEETLIPVFYLSSYYPHVIICILLNFMGSAIISGIFGVMWGKIVFLLILALTMARIMVDEYKLSKIRGPAGLSMGIEEIMLF